MITDQGKVTRLTLYNLRGHPLEGIASKLCPQFVRIDQHLLNLE